LKLLQYSHVGSITVLSLVRVVIVANKLLRCKRQKLKTHNNL